MANEKGVLLKILCLITIKKRRVSAILIALNSSNELVSLARPFRPEELSTLKKQEQYFCPGCGANLVLKAGEVKIPHFAHRSLADCDSFSEPETPLHLHGKLQLHQFFSRFNHHIELEKYLPAIKQRADLLVGQKTAIEFQYSAIPASQVRSRSEGYRSIAIEPLWISGAPMLQPDGIQLIRLRQFERQMVRHSNGVDYLLSFCPETNVFTYASGLFWMGGNRWAAKLKSLPASAQQFPFAIPKKLAFEEYKAIFRLSAAQRDAFVRSQQYAILRHRNPFWLLAYELKLNRLELPAIIGVPFAAAGRLDERPVIWQMRVIKAIRNRMPLAALLDEGVIKPSLGTSDEKALALLEDYAGIYSEITEDERDDGKLMEVLYAHYCKNA